MRVTLRLRFCTHFGQGLFVTGNHELFGDGDLERAFPLEYVDQEFWQITIFVPQENRPKWPIVYNYLLREPDGVDILDSGRDRVLDFEQLSGRSEVLIVDSWNSPEYYQNAFYTEPFKKVLFPESTAEFSKPPAYPSHIFRVKAPLLAKGEILCLLGSARALRNWDQAAPVLLNRYPHEDFFTVSLDLANEPASLDYKYGVFDTIKNQFKAFEGGPDRHLPARKPAPGSLTIINDGFAVLPDNIWKGAGVAIPVFSLRSANSFGVGEFLDLKPLVDWCVQTGLKLIQVLPVNDTRASGTWHDSYPYAAISAFALHPIYLNLERAAGDRHKTLLAKLEPERKRLNALDALDYEAVMRVKLDFLRQLYALQKERTLLSKAYKEFFRSNEHWLVPYAAFCYLRDKYRTGDFAQWPEHKRFDAQEIAALAASRSEVADAMAFSYFIQYHLHLQLREAVEYSHHQSVILKGDIPIGVSRYGADTWQEPEQYHLDVQAGAPPDAFARKGQNWGFPTYNWERMQETGFAWWRQRFEQMSRYFDAFRIDHILGFFRIWSIPSDAIEGILGRFVPALPVRPEEFAARGMTFDPTRFVKPHITSKVLHSLFGPDVALVRQKFLDTDRFGRFGLKPAFSTQRQVERHFAGLERTDRNERLKFGLYDLISNVILLENPGGMGGRTGSAGSGAEYHFRFAIEETPSFQDLDVVTQAALKELYVDYFFRRQDTFWMRGAMQKLPALKRATNMLVCGEDLGLVPACVPGVMKALGILSLEIQRMPKDPRQEFFRPANAPYLSVVTPSTHDMSTIRGWWEEDSAVRQRFYNMELNQPGPTPRECEPWINRLVVAQHLNSPAMWSVFQLQDLLGMDATLRRPNPAEERINVPANPENYWRYRMHISLEALNEAADFNQQLKGLVSQSGR